MRKRFAGLAVMLCLMAAILAFPAFAQAAPSASVAGTITAGSIGLPNIDVEVWESCGDHYHPVALASTDASGAYSVTMDPTPQNDGQFVVLASDPATGAYEPTSSARFTLTDGDSKTVSLAMKKDSKDPDAYVNGNGTGPEDWSNEDVLVSFLGTDRETYLEKFEDSMFRGSGVSTFTYSINGGTSVVATNPVANVDYSSSSMTTISVDGINLITFSATDRAGNASKVRTALVYIDKTAPVTSYDANSANGTTIKLVAEDTASGVAGTYWRMGNTGEFKWGTLASVPATGVGELQFFSVDKTGNMETVKKLSVQSRATLTTPKASTKKPRANKKFYVKGSVTGRAAAAGQVRIYKFSKGTYKYVAKKSFTTSSTGAYKVTVKLKAGSYKFKAFYGANTATSSDPLASSAFSAKSVVKK